MRRSAELEIELAAARRREAAIDAEVERVATLSKLNDAERDRLRELFEGPCECETYGICVVCAEILKLRQRAMAQ